MSARPSNKQRPNSVRNRSNAHSRKRTGIFSQSFHAFLVGLKRCYWEIFAAAEKEIVDRYLTWKAIGCFSICMRTAAR
jgi:hypothetical protein